MNMGPNAGFEIAILTERQTARFWSHVQIGADDVCWKWTGTSFGGYGRVNINHRNYIAHRVAFFIKTGINPGKKVVAHRCDNKICCNPEHLFLASQKENILDCIRKGRANRPAGAKHWRSQSRNKMEVQLAL